MLDGAGRMPSSTGVDDGPASTARQPVAVPVAGTVRRRRRVDSIDRNHIVQCGPCPRAHGYTGLAALAWFLWHWNLIGWQYA
jgi:hypothetical protein